LERRFSKLKRFRRVATRFEKAARIRPWSPLPPSSYGCDKCHGTQFTTGISRRIRRLGRVAVFGREKLLENGQPVPSPKNCDGVFAVIDTHRRPTPIMMQPPQRSSRSTSSAIVRLSLSWIGILLRSRERYWRHGCGWCLIGWKNCHGSAASAVARLAY